MSAVELSATLKEGYQVENTSRGHQWISDEPKELKGDDTGPKPSELLLSALASCKLITMRMYAQRKEWDFQGADIHLKVLEVKERTLIEKSITYHGDLTEEQKERLTVISGRCPVVRMVSNSVEFKLV